MIEKVVHDGSDLALIIRDSFDEPGIHFFTPDDYSQQLAYMQHPLGKVIQPHIHNKVDRTVSFTQEVLVIKKGRLRVDFYTTEMDYIKSKIISAGDIILLVSGGHGFEVLEELVMVEIKQGPYVGERDKTRFENVSNTKLIME